MAPNIFCASVYMYNVHITARVCTAHTRATQLALVQVPTTIAPVRCTTLPNKLNNTRDQFIEPRPRYRRGGDGGNIIIIITDEGKTRESYEKGVDTI